MRGKLRNEGKDLLVAKNDENSVVDRDNLSTKEGTGCVQIVHLTDDQAVHCPEDWVQIRHPDPVAKMNVSIK